MDLATKPVLIKLKWAEGASGSYVHTVPFPSQLPGSPGAASYTDGFPPATGTPIAAGGIPPDQRDMNGVLQMLSDNIRWFNAGAPFQFDSDFASTVGGYPQGTRLLSTDGLTVWVSQVDSNTTDPDAGPSANWRTAAYMDNAAKVGAVEFAAFAATDNDIYLVANGRSLLRATYPRLFAAIGTLWGSADGTHFNIPDLRSMFIQGIDLSRGLDDPVALGATQQDQFQGHAHNQYGAGAGANKKIISDDEAAAYTQPSSGPIDLAGSGTARFGLTTHPRNVGMTPIIYY